MANKRVSPTGFAVRGAVVALILGSTVAWAQFQPEKSADAKHLLVRATILVSDPFSESNRPASGASKPIELARGEIAMLQLQVEPEKDWYTYPLTQRAPDQLEAQLIKLTIEGGEAIQPVYPLMESPPEWKRSGDENYLAHIKPFTVTQPIYVKPTAKPGSSSLRLILRAQVCSKICVWEDHSIEIPCTISNAEPIPTTPEMEQRLATKPQPPTVVPVSTQSSTKTSSQPKETSKEEKSGAGSAPARSSKTPSLWISILTAILGGYASLLTPCVFPMVPITVSYFLKQSEEKHSATLGMVVVYCGTLVLVLTLGGLLLLKVLVAISVHWVTNFLLGGIFLFFALSLLGMYDITLPSWLQDLTSSGEGKGGLIGVFFMALTFSIVSFACVGPIYGGFISLQATSDTPGSYLLQGLPVLAFSLAFASPFFLLALFPSMLRSMPRAGSWMNSVKVVMGFLELAAVVKFLRAAELSYTQSSNILTFDFSLGLYVAISFACGVYLLGLYRLPHDHDVAETIGVPRLIFSLAFLSLGVYLTPGLWKSADGDGMRPRGTVFAWVESFLLPDTDSGGKKQSGGASNSSQLVWHSKLSEALAEAEREKKLVFIDFTGMLCTNCKLNERNVFTRSEVQSALSQHVLLKLYTDYVPSGIEQSPNAEEAFAMRNKTFNTIALPLYALLRPKGESFEIVRQDEQGLIENVPGFVQFLKP